MKHILPLLLTLCLFTACHPQATAPHIPLPPTTTPPTPAPGALSADETATLSSLILVSDYPLYTMHYTGSYASYLAGLPTPSAAQATSSWACSLLAAFADPQNMLYGRNFDWDFSPALLLFTDPEDGYASASMVDIAFLGFNGKDATRLDQASLEMRKALLAAPSLPFDGINERGLVIGMAAVPPGNMPIDPRKPTIGSLGIIRQLLDHAANVDEALKIMQGYNIDTTGGPPIHYLIADAAGHAALVEYYQGQMVITASPTPWHMATNFLRAQAGEQPKGWCERYDHIAERMQQTQGRLAPSQAMQLLSDVSQDSTQWSVVYQINTLQINIVMGRDYAHFANFTLNATP